jgi:hypothetical protein
MALILVLNTCLTALRQAFQGPLERLDWRDLGAVLWLVLMLPVFVWTGLAMLAAAALLGSILVTMAAGRWLRRRAGRPSG